METWATQVLLQESCLLPCSNPRTLTEMQVGSEDRLWQMHKFPSPSPATAHGYFIPDWVFLVTSRHLTCPPFSLLVKTVPQVNWISWEQIFPCIRQGTRKSYVLVDAFPIHPSQLQQYQSLCTSCCEILELFLASACPPGLTVVSSQY